ncbi:MAG: pyridoxal 5'-phosphate synthase glutaminase subunit PdxT [Cyanobacteria bacterium HKST-UBA02]|nr:pyridoxal 5'-phosphate synthase glutaminase subunit PdxT [Cyanobacteria bacterium HKST-UBA02]
MQTQSNSGKTIGVLALQGDVAEHLAAIGACGLRALAVRYEEDLDAVDGLIIPGGESTTIARLTEAQAKYLLARIKTRAEGGMPVYGTCMGSIMLASTIEASPLLPLSLMDITIGRNAYGPQKASFEADIEIPVLGPEPFRAVFIRAPMIKSCGEKVETLASFDGSVVMARQGNFLVTTFHPEITSDLRVHKLFADMVTGGPEKEVEQRTKQPERRLARLSA